MPHDQDRKGRINATSEEIKTQNKCQINEHDRVLLIWLRNVDKGYAWVVLAAMFSIMSATLGSYRVYGFIYARVTREGVYSREEASSPVSMIYTVENLVGPLVSILACGLLYRKTLFIGGFLLTLGNSLAAFSTCLWLDTVSLGVIQGIGYAFIFAPLMEITNSYFIRYRTIALGFVLCGGTLSIFALAPIFRWLLDVYPWRSSYFGIAVVCSIIMLMSLLLKPNPKPRLEDRQRRRSSDRMITITRISTEANPYQSRARCQSTTSITSPADDGVQNRSSLISVSSLDPEQADEAEAMSGLGQSSDSGLSIIWQILKIPGFHLIWYSQLIYFWVFTIWCLVLIDYGIDRGCTEDEAKSMLMFQSIGELTGQLALTALVDMRFLSNKNVVILVLLIMSGLLVLVTCVQGYIWFAAITVTCFSMVSLLYVLLNGLLVDQLGERRVTIGYGTASCIGGLLMSFRPQAVGYFRDIRGTYDPLMICLAISCAFGALLWMLEPLLTRAATKRTQSASGNQECIS